MVHDFKLNEKPFSEIEKGTKKIELRLYDEKRSKIQLNDYIIFHKITDESQTIKVKVKGLLRYNTFEELFNDIDYNLSGSANSLSEKLKSIHKIYSEEKEKQYGILAISIEKCE